MGDNTCKEEITLDIANLPEHGIILGQPWLCRHNLSIDWRKEELRFKYNDKQLLIANSMCIEEDTAKHTSKVTRITTITAKQTAKAVKKNSVAYLMMMHVLEHDDDIDV